MIKLKAEKCPWKGAIEFCIFDESSAGLFVGEVAFRQVAPAEVIGPPSLVLKGDAAQALMDDLWRCGIRPSEGTGSAGQLAAVERHLNHVAANHDRLLTAILSKRVIG